MTDDDCDAPRDEKGNPICARPCRDGMPCYRRVRLPGAACYHHDRDQPILPLPDPVPSYDLNRAGNAPTDGDSTETTINEE